MISVSIAIARFIKPRCIVIAILLFAISVLLQLYFKSFIARYYEYMGYHFSPDLVKYMISNLAISFFILTSFTVSEKGDFYYSVYILVLLLFFIPGSILYAFMDLPDRWYLLYIIFMVIFYFNSYIRFHIRDLHLSYKQQGIFLFTILILFGLPFLVDIGKYSPNIKVLFFEEIYQTRANFAANSTSLTKYSYFFIIKLFAPVLFVYGLIHKKFFYPLIAFSILTFIYLISGHKTVYFALFILLMFYFTGGSASKRVQLVLIIIVLSLLFVVPVIDYFLKSRLFRFMISERIFFDQSLVTYFYYDFFYHKPIFFSESLFFDKIFNYPYDLPSANLIGREYFGNPISHVNTGIIGDAFMSLGSIGVGLITFLTSLIFSFFNSLKIDERYFGVFFLYLFDLQNSSFLSIMFSGGMMFLIIFAFLIMSKKDV